MAHEPDIFARMPDRVSLTVSGHTHGGQVRLFGISPIVPSDFGDRYAYGHIREGGPRPDRIGRPRLFGPAGPLRRSPGNQPDRTRRRGLTLGCGMPHRVAGRQAGLFGDGAGVYFCAVPVIGDGGKQMSGYRRVMVFGGTGVTGRLIAERLATSIGADITIAGRNGAAAEQTARALGARLPERVFTAAEIDIADTEALVAALADIDLLIVAAPVAEHMDRIGRAALDSGTDMLDILVRALAAEKVKSLAAAARQTGRVLVTGAGFHPGVLGPMMRMATRGLSRANAVHIGMAMQAQFRDAQSATEIIADIAEPTHVLENGQWRRAGTKDLRAFTFGPPLGSRYCYPLNMPEVETVGRELGLENAGVYAAGFNWFVDYVAFSLMFVAHRIGGNRLAQATAPLFYWGNRWFSPKQSCIEMRAEASGEIDGNKAVRSFCLSSSEPYALTAHCVVAAVRQMLDGPLSEPGVSLMGERIDPDRLFADLEGFGAKIWTQ